MVQRWRGEYAGGRQDGRQLGRRRAGRRRGCIPTRHVVGEIERECACAVRSRRWDAVRRQRRGYRRVAGRVPRVHVGGSLVALSAGAGCGRECRVAGGSHGACRQPVSAGCVGGRGAVGCCWDAGAGVGGRCGGGGRDHAE